MVHLVVPCSARLPRGRRPLASRRRGHARRTTDHLFCAPAALLRDVPQHRGTGQARSLPLPDHPCRNSFDDLVLPGQRYASRPDEHLYGNEPTGPDGDEVGVAVPFAAFQLVSVHDEHTVLAGLDQLQDLLRPQAACRREAPFQEFLFVDVVIVRAGEHEAVGNQPPGTAAPSLSPPGSARRCRRGAAWPRRACADRPATAARRSCCRWSRGSCRPHPPARRRWRPAARRHASRRSRGRPRSGW